jgi:hypothetical protein
MEYKQYKQMVTVYFETPNGSYAERIAVFFREADYIDCLPALEELAKSRGMIITESMD